MRVIHARPSPLPVLFCFFKFCLYFVSACMFVFFFILACLCPFFSLLFLRMKNSNRQIRRLHAYLTNKSTPCKPTCCIQLHHLRKIRVNCLKEKLKTLVHTVFIRISAQPRISAHPSSPQSNSNKHSPPPHPIK